MSNYFSGHKAEKIAAEYLESLGFNIKDINWKTKFCEIDIVAEKDKTFYLVEVKSRKTSYQGEGFDYITDKKLRQMAYAAEFWVNQNKWDGDYQLSAISIDEGKISFLSDVY